MNVAYRPLRPGEVPLAADVFIVGLTDLVRRFSLPPAPFTRDAMVPVFAHIRETGIFEVAESEGRIVSICAALVREDVWFLSMFWTLPEHQRRGIGRPLLERVWQKGRERGAKKHFVWSSVDPVAVATYMRMGMLPGCQMLVFAGTPSGLTDPPREYATREADAAFADALDRVVWGAARSVDHRFLTESGAVRRDVVFGEERVGYYVARNGSIGPAAWSEDRHADAVLSFAFAEAARQASEVRLASPGITHAAIRFALARRLKLIGTPHLLLTAPTGALQRYVPSGPALF